MFTLTWDRFEYSSRQFGIWRIIFGFYLLVYYIRTFPYATELFSSANNMPTALESTFSTFYPLRLLNLDSPAQVNSILGLCILFSFMIMIGFYRRWAAFGLWILVMWLYNRNPYSDSPEYSFINWLILALALIPDGEDFSVMKKNNHWAMPKIIYWGAWIILAVGYFYAGSVKFKGHDSAWMDGTAMYYVLVTDDGRLSWYGHLFDNVPKFYFWPLTWGALGMQTLAFLFVISKRMRPWWWLVSTGVHLGLSLFVNLAQVSLGMAVFHFFIFDMKWIEQFKGLLFKFGILKERGGLNQAASINH